MNLLKKVVGQGEVLPSKIGFAIMVTFSLMMSSIVLNSDPASGSGDTGSSDFIRDGAKQSPADIEYKYDIIASWFSENRGQLEDPGVHYIYTGADFTIGFMQSGYLIRITGEDNLTSVMKVTFEGSNPVLPEGIEEKEVRHRTNYFLGNDPFEWRTNIPGFREILYEDVYNGIDLIFYTTDEGVKYDFIVTPGPRNAMPGDICLSYDGADIIKIDSSGDLHITTTAGEIVEKAPFCYYSKDGRNIEVPSRYRIDGNSIGFEIGHYDPAAVLVIDPLLFSTFIGGKDYDHGASVVLDAENNAYVTGNTLSPDFPTTPGCYNDSRNGTNAFVCKLNGQGDLLYSTFIGGESADIGLGIALDSGNNVYITGRTDSPDFPATDGCYSGTYNSGQDVFACKLNSDGSDLIYSTFIGGGAREYGFAMALDSENNAYITGRTQSSNFPTTEGCHDDIKNGSNDVFVCKLNHNGSSLLYSTYVGGNDSDKGFAIALDSERNAYVTGHTLSSDFPTTTGCFDDTRNGVDEYSYDVFVFKLNQDGTDLAYSTYVGGEESDRSYGIAIDSGNNVYVIGTAYSTDFPTTPDCHDDMMNGNSDAFVFKLNGDGSDLVYSTFVGGGSFEIGENIVIDREKRAHITGKTESTDFPTTGSCYDDSFDGGYGGDLFVCKLSPDGSEMLYSTYVGGGGSDYGFGIALDADNNVYVTGETESTDFPTTPGCYNESHNKYTDVFVLKLNITIPLARIDRISPSPSCKGQNVSFEGLGYDDGSIERYVWYSSIDGEFHNDIHANCRYSGLSVGEHEIYFKVRDDLGLWSETDSEILVIHERPVAHMDFIRPSPARDTDGIHFRGLGTDDGTIELYAWRSSVDGEFYNGTRNEFEYGGLSTGIHTVHFRVKDNHEVWSEEVNTTLRIFNLSVNNAVWISDTDEFSSMEIGILEGIEPDRRYFFILNRTGEDIRTEFYTYSLVDGVYYLEIRKETYYIRSAETNVNVSGNEPTGVNISSLGVALEMSSKTNLPMERIMVTRTSNSNFLHARPLSLDCYVDVSVSNRLSNSLDSALIKVYYSEDDIPEGLNETSLRLFYFNDTDKGWEPVSVCGINTEENYVWANVSHFSLFGIDEFNFPPMADAVGPLNGIVGREVTFCGKGTDFFNRNIIVLYEWDFDGDGVYDWSSSTNCSVDHIYESPGTYHAKLRITDDGGGKGFDIVEVSIEEKDEGDTSFPAYVYVIVVILIGLSIPIAGYIYLLTKGGKGLKDSFFKLIRGRKLMKVLLFMVVSIVVMNSIYVVSGEGEGASDERIYSDTLISDISSSNYNPIQGEKVILSATVYNGGDNSTYTTIWFGFSDNFSAIGEVHTLTEPDNSSTVKIELDTTNMEVGETPILVMVRKSSPPESNISNNVGGASIGLKIRPVEGDNGMDVFWTVTSIAGMVGLIVAGLMLYNMKMKRPDFQMTDVFLVYNDGRLILHETTRMRPGFDAEIVSSMLTAVQDFVKDSFREDEEYGKLKELVYEDFKILIENGEYAYICVALAGSDRVPEEMQGRLKEALSIIEDRFSDSLKHWTGEASLLSGTRNVVNEVIIMRKE